MILIMTGSKTVSREGTAEQLSREFRSMATTLAEVSVPAKLHKEAHKSCDRGIYEILKNVLHGRGARIEIEILPGNIVRITTVDWEGEDQLNPDYCGHNAKVYLKELFGAENIREEQDGKSYRCEVTVIPERVLRAVS